MFQSLEWGHFCSEYLDYRPRYLFALGEGGETEGALMIFQTAALQDLFFERPLGRWALRILRKARPSFSWSFGPVVANESTAASASCGLVEGALGLIGQSRRGRLGFTLPVYDASLVRLQKEALQTAFGFKWTTRATLLVDLRPDCDVLWQGLKRSARKAVKSAQRNGIEVRRLETIDELQRFHRFAVDCRSGLGLRTYSFENIAAAWRNLRPAGGIEVFSASLGGELIAGLGIWSFNGILNEFMSVQSKRCNSEKLCGGDAIKWEVIKWGHDSGARTYDLQGVAVDPASPKEAGIRRFKEKWGGVYTEIEMADGERSALGWRGQNVVAQTD